ncbi:MAG: hypothetical protein Q4C75_07490 [Bergeyella zoohelcum]|nr:hypothetical protein [Bergeyella zoohelcum]
MANKEITHEVSRELEVYVYRLIDPRTNKTFYVGKGKGNRIFSHLYEAEKLISKDEEGEDDEVSLKIATIREIQKSGNEVLCIIHRHGMDEKTAFEVESALIDAYGENGELTNLVKGHRGNDFGMMSIDAILKKYAAEELDIENLPHKLLLININRSVGQREVYDAVRFSWKINEQKAKQADYVLAVERGLVVGVFIADEWKLARKNHFPELIGSDTEFNEGTNKRKGFIGREAPNEIQSLYLNKRIPKTFYPKGSANPIRYIGI